MHPIIETMAVRARFRYLWLKYVTGVNLNYHCAKCLLGEYSQTIKHTSLSHTNVKLDRYPADYYYLCGVSSPYRWVNNFHLAFKYQPGSMIEVSENGITIKIRNAERIPISTYEMLIRNHKHVIDLEYATCRNWQFANMIAKDYDA